MMTFPTEWKIIKVMFQTTKQFWIGLEDPGPMILIDIYGSLLRPQPLPWTVQGSGSAHANKIEGTA
jgi:hypothetical protein